MPAVGNFQDGRIIRTREQVEELVEAIQAEVDDPRITEGVDDLKVYLIELRHTLDTGRVMDYWTEAGYWLVNESGTLGRDYGVE